MSMFKEKLMSCKKCSLSASKKPLAGWGDGNKLFVVGLAPSDFRSGNYENAMKPISDSDTANILMNCFKDCRLKEKDFYLTNLTKCSFLENKLDKSIFDICYNEWLIKEIISVTPYKVVCLGKEVYDFLSQKDYLEDIFDIKEVWHHSYIARNRNKYDEWIRQWKMILN